MILCDHWFKPGVQVGGKGQQEEFVFSHSEL